MDLIFNNPLVNLNGITFLLFYIPLIIFSLVLFLIFKRRFDQTDKLPMLRIPSNPNPFEIAYLRGGENEMARSIVFSLVQKEFLKIYSHDKKTFVSLNNNQPNWTLLSEIEKQTLIWFQTTRNIDEIFAKNGLASEFSPHTEKLKNTFERLNLLTTAQIKSRVRITALMIWGVLALIGFYKIGIAVWRGHSNIMITLIAVFISLIAFLIAANINRLTKLGKNYIGQLQTAFQGVKMQMNANANNLQQRQTEHFGFSPHLLAVGVFGVGALSGTQFNQFEETFHKSAAAGGSGCGSSCGSSCSSGSSCGGSSCGGGGCGGCS